MVAVTPGSSLLYGCSWCRYSLQWTWPGGAAGKKRLPGKGPWQWWEEGPATVLGWGSGGSLGRAQPPLKGAWPPCQDGTRRFPGKATVLQQSPGQPPVTCWRLEAKTLSRALLVFKWDFPQRRNWSNQVSISQIRRLIDFAWSPQFRR